MAIRDRARGNDRVVGSARGEAKRSRPVATVPTIFTHPEDKISEDANSGFAHPHTARRLPW